MNKKKALITLLVVVVLAIGTKVLYKINQSKEYSVVYLTTGEVYIGKLSTFPDLALKDSYILQIAQDPSDPKKNNFQINPIKDALWAPKKINLIKENVVFYGPLSPESSIAKTLAQQSK